MKRRDTINPGVIVGLMLLVVSACTGSAGIGTPSTNPASSAAGTGGAAVNSGAGSSIPGASAAADPTLASSDLPCDVGDLLRSRCADCHGATTKFGAPMSLMTVADFKRPAQDHSRTVGQAAIARVNDDAHPMPQAPAARLSSTETATLTGWINAGTKPASPTDSCQIATSAGAGAPSGATTGTGGAGGDIDMDPDVTCYDLTAHAPTGKKIPYQVPTTPDLYHCFSFAPPWGTDKVQMVDWKPLIDNDKVIHHWILYNDAGTVTDGADVDCSGAHPSAQMVTGWAPGGGGSPLPRDVGQDVSGLGFTLEIHYNNTVGSPQPDASGVTVCVTKKLRPNEAGIHWLGTESIVLPAGGKASGVCKPTTQTPVTIISSTPHMHLLGRHLTTIINRVDGTTETLIDKPFEFASQVAYLTPQTINPGDTLTTTCTYGGAAFYGQGTKQEMCYNFVLAYPNGGLASGSLLRKNGCTGL